MGICSSTPTTPTSNLAAKIQTNMYRPQPFVQSQPYVQPQPPQPQYSQSQPPPQYVQSPPPYLQSQVSTPFVEQPSCEPIQKQSIVVLPPRYNIIKFDTIRDEEEREPMLLLDRTASMKWPTSAQCQTPRKDTIKEAVKCLVCDLAEEDSQAVDEQDEEGGGIRTITFAGKRAEDIGDLNPNNLEEKWARIDWSGTTWIMPGWRKLLQVYHDEFGARPFKDQPLLMATIITDGESEDTDDFAAALAQAHGNVYCSVAVIGYGQEHDRAVRKYMDISNRNKHVRVIPFDGETNHTYIAKALKQMIG